MLFDPLEPRTLLAFSGAEVELAELINRARANPAVEAARLGLDFAAGLTWPEQQLLVPHEPLALSDSLSVSARAHALDMGTRGFFDHLNPNGFDPTTRAHFAGYAGTAGENIGAGYATISDLYQYWMSSPEERRNILSLNIDFDSTYHYDDIGIGLALNVPNAAYPSYYAADFGNPTAHTTKLLGVLFTDTNANAFYNAGEGLANIRIEAFTGPAATGTPVATFTTDAAGNYQLPLSSGTYTIRFTRLADNYQVTKPAVISNQNLEVSARASEFAPPPDDFPSAGEWSIAASFPVDSSTGSGQRIGALQALGDSDLFTFTAPRSGLATFSALPAAGAFNARIRIYNAAQSLLATGTSSSPVATTQTTLAAGATYFILIDAGAASPLTGGYTLQIDGPTGNSTSTIPPEYLAGTNLPITTTFYGNKPVVSFINQLGRPVVAIRSALGTWSWYSDLIQSTGAPEINANSSVPTWVDPSDNLLYAAASSPSGLLLFRRAADGSWSYRNLTSEIRVSRPIVSSITTFVNPAGLRQISGLDANGHLITYWMTGQMWPQGWRYYFTDLATRDLVYNNHPMPALSSTVPITSYATRVDTVNIIAATDAGAVILFYRASGGLGQSLWNWANLSRITGTPPLIGALTSSETTGGIVNISGVDASGNLWMITWRGGQGWRATNVSQTAAGGSGGAIVPGSITSWINAAGSGFVAALTTLGDIIIYRYTFTGSQNTWTLATLPTGTLTGLTLTGPLRAATLANGTILITAATATNEAIRLTFNPGQTWSTENISDLLAP